jgi:hypothetical protein
MINNPISETLLQTAIAEWLALVLGVTFWDGSSDRSSNQLAFVWHMQQQPRVGTPLLMGRISGIHKIARDYLSQPREEVLNSVNCFAIQQSGTREFTLYLESFGKDSLSRLCAVQGACDSLPLLGILDTAGIAVVDASDVRDAHTFLGTMPEERALIEIRMRTSSEKIIANLNIIEAVQIHGIVNNGWIDVDLPTLTIDTITP